MTRTRRILCLTVVFALAMALSIGAIAPLSNCHLTVSANEEPTPEPTPEPTLEPTPEPEEPTKLASLYVQDLNITPIYAQPRQVVSIDVNVVNDGETWGSKTFYLIVNGVNENAKSVGVSPNTSNTVNFVVYRVVPGEYNIQIDDEYGTFYIVDEASAESGVGYGPLDTGGIIAVVVIGIIVAGGLVVVFVLSRGI